MENHYKAKIVNVTIKLVLSELHKSWMKRKDMKIIFEL